MNLSNSFQMIDDADFSYIKIKENCFNISILGIYKITNKITGKGYVGSSINLEYRWARHFKMLRAGTHHSPHLQASYDKYGEEVFEVSILEELERISDLVELKRVMLSREQYWIDTLGSADGTRGYNACPVAGSNLGRKMTQEGKKLRTEKMKLSGTYGSPSKGKTRSEEYRKKMSATKKGTISPKRGTKLPEETKQKIRETLLSDANTWRGSKQSKESIIKMKEAQQNRTAPPSMQGKHHSEEAKKKISEAKVGKPNGRQGKHPSQETRDKISAANKGKPNEYWLGRKHSPESIEKMRIAQAGKIMSEETREKISKGHLGRKQSPESIAKRAKATSKPVINLTTSEVFASIKEACLRYNLDSGSISCACRGILKKVGGFSWRYLNESNN